MIEAFKSVKILADSLANHESTSSKQYQIKEAKAGNKKLCRFYDFFFFACHLN